jgi:hypothetical protein
LVRVCFCINSDCLCVFRSISFMFPLQQTKTPGCLVLGSLEWCCVLLHYGPPGPLANLWCAIITI